MSTLATMRERTEREIHRGDLNAEIIEAIKTAIQNSEGQRFWFNEGSTSFTVSQTSFYALPSQVVDVDKITITVNGDEYPLVERTFDYLEDISVNDDAYVGYPREFAIYEDRIRIYPTPSDNYLVKMSYLRRFDTLSASTDTNPWLTHAEKFIRSLAKAELYSHVLHDERKASIQMQSAQQALDSLEMRSGKLTTGRLRPTEF